MEQKTPATRTWILLGIIGALLMGAGDWLLGYVDPTPVAGAPWDWLKTGYTEGFALWRPMVAMALGGLAILFYLPAMWSMSKIFREETCRRKNGWMMVAGLFGWPMIHNFFGAVSCLYAWACARSGVTFAGEAVAALREAMAPGVMLWYVVMVVPFLVHIVDILRGKSYYSRKIALAHPLVWYLVICLISALLPASLFANGLYTFSMNGAMLVWFLTGLFWVRRAREENAHLCKQGAPKT